MYATFNINVTADAADTWRLGLAARPAQVDRATLALLIEPAEAAAALAVFPNPVEDESTIQLVVPEAGRVRLELRDAAGRLVSIVLDQEMAEGDQQVLLDAGSLTSGIYSLVLRCNDQQPVFAQIAIH